MDQRDMRAAQGSLFGERDAGDSPAVPPLGTTTMAPEIAVAAPDPSPAEAEAAALEGMERAADHADRANGFDSGRWREEALNFLFAFARGNRYFISENVSAASRVAELTQPPTDRAWGPVYKDAQKHGYIVQDGSGKSARRHNSICPRWRSLIATADAKPGPAAPPDVHAAYSRQLG